MNLQKIFVPVAGVVLLAGAWRAWGWPGVALVVGGLLMWLLLHFTRLMKVMQRAGRRPVGYCDSAVMLHARLRPKLPLLHVVALTNSLGEQLSPPETQPEVFRWTDGSASHVTCEFVQGKLVKWVLERPPVAEEGAVAGAEGAPPAGP